jgi:RNA-splicing ligase RtcB
MLEIKGKYTTAKIMIDDVEESALSQVYNLVNHPAFTEKIVMQVDIHAGSGAPIGFTMPLCEKISPNICGVDIGCGMLSVNIGNDFTTNKDKLLKFDEKIRNVVPMGSNVMDRSAVPSKFFEKNFNWKETNDVAKKFMVSYNKKFGTNYSEIEFTYEWFLKKCKEIGMKQSAELAIGTLGGGNHFIEIGLSDTTGNFWVTVHTGSRNFGKMVCEYHMRVAKKILDGKRNVSLKSQIEDIRKNFSGVEIVTKIKEAKKELGIDFEIDMKGMEYLEGQFAIDYFMDMIFAQAYSRFNRATIADKILKAVSAKEIEKIESIHNYINFEDMIIRKGAITSYVGEKMIIPFSMKDGMLICEGKSNPEWNFSANHGAGRVMSRGDASRKVDLKDFEFQMKGIVSTSVCKATLDESPQAYKNPKMIEESIGATATILDRVKPILNMKDAGESKTWKEKREDQKKEKSRDNNRKEMRKMRGK